MPADLNTALVNLSTQIANKAATATAEELAYLSKAVEGIGGKANVLDIQILSDQRKSEITALGDAKKNEVIDLTASKKDEIVTLTGAKKTEIDTLAATRRAEFNANAASADLTTRATNLEGRATTTEAKTASFQSDLPIRKVFAANAVSLTLAAADMAAMIEIDGPKALDFTTVDLVLPDATLIAGILSREIVVKNRTLARLQVKAAGGTNLGVLTPYGFGRLTLTEAKSTVGVWRLTALTAPIMRDRINVTGSNIATNWGEQGGWSPGSGIFGAASYSDNVYLIPHTDDNGANLKVALLTTVFQNSNSYRGLLIGPALLDGGYSTSLNYAFSNTSYTWSGNSILWSATPVRGGIVTFGCQNSTGTFDVNYIRPPYNNRTTLMSEGYSGTTAPYYATAMTFDDGRILVLVLYNGSGQATSIRRFRFKADGTAEAAGSITLPQSNAAVYPVNGTTIALTTNGTTLSIFDPTQAGTSWTPSATNVASPFPVAAMSNRIALPVGRDCLLATDGAYRFDGSAFTKLAGGATYLLPFGITNWQVLTVHDGLIAVQREIGPGDQYRSNAYFFEADGTLWGRDLARVLGETPLTGTTAARVTPLGGDTFFTSISWGYTYNTSTPSGGKGIVTSLSRSNAGGFGISALGGKI